MEIINTLNEFPKNNNINIFLGGTLENTENNWNEKICNYVKNNVTFFISKQLNNLENSYTNDEIEWEHSALIRANLILLFFNENIFTHLLLTELIEFKHKPIAIYYSTKNTDKNILDFIVTKNKISNTSNKQIFFAKTLSLIKSIK